ncbi:MAG: matrixin family metalloprotease [Deltaproteobacteria bacterium]|jgi:hypothetical protein
MRAFLAAAVLLAPSSAWAYECTVVEDDPDIPVTWPQRAVAYAVTESLGLSFSDVQAAFGAWEDVPCSDITFSFEGVVERDAARQVLVDSVTEGWDDSASDAVALTTLQYELSNGRIRTARIELNFDDFILGDTTSELCDAQGRLHDHRSVLTHEVGHLLGLSHTQSYSGAPTDPTMAPRVDPCDASKRDLAPDDVEAICALYPVGARGACHGRAVRTGGEEGGGCTTTGVRPDFAVLALLLLGLKTCRKPRSGG